MGATCATCCFVAVSKSHFVGVTCETCCFVAVSKSHFVGVTCETCCFVAVSKSHLDWGPHVLGKFPSLASNNLLVVQATCVGIAAKRSHTQLSH